MSVNKQTVKQQRTSSKQPWNSFLTDLSQFSLTKEEILARKKRLVSKNNIFLSPNNATTRRFNGRFTARRPTFETKKSNESNSTNDTNVFDILEQSSVLSDNSRSVEEAYFSNGRKISIRLFASDTENSGSSSVIGGDESESVIENFTEKSKRTTNQAINLDPRSKRNAEMNSNMKYRLSPASIRQKRLNKSSKAKQVFCQSKPNSVKSQLNFQSHILTPQEKLEKKSNDEEYDEVYFLIDSLCSELKHYELLTGHTTSFSAEVCFDFVAVLNAFYFFSYFSLLYAFILCSRTISIVSIGFIKHFGK